ncbi:MAG: beta-lactamase family protein, partial [Gemmatimonadota bacterium]|nr:beta-lactamase family protein [Gemmatimonadota bacterium]
MRLPAASVILAVLVSACARTALPRTDPIPVDAALSMQLAPAARTLDSAIAAGAAPGAVLAVSVGGRHFEHGIGQLAVDDPRPPDGRTIYDMASLTKVVALTTLAMMAVQENRIALDSPVVHYLSEFARGSGEKSRVVVRNLLLHDSGLPPDPIPPLWKHPGSRQSALAEALGANLDTVPGARMVYSDLGAITLATIIERQY